MLTPRHSTLLQILDSPWFHLSIINLSVCLYGLWCDNCPIVLVRWHQRGLCPSDTDRYKEMFWQGKGIGRKPNNRMVSRVGLLCTLYSALMCRDVGRGQWLGLTSLWRRGRGLLDTGARGERASCEARTLHCNLCFVSNEHSFMSRDRRTIDKLDGSCFIVSVCLFVRGQLGLLSHTTTIVRIWCGQNSRVVEVSTWPIFISMHRVHSKCQCQQRHSLFNNNGEHTLYTI